MRKIILPVAVTFLLLFQAKAQTENAGNKSVDHYLGFQANQLLRQILNLSNSTTAINNPYTLTYSIIWINSGWGINVGLGYDYSNTHDKTPIDRTSGVNDFFYRLGGGRKVMISNRFQVGYGFDIVGDTQHNRTQSSSVTIGFNGDSITSSSDVTSKTGTLGFGLQLSLGYYLSNKVILGTETTYYRTSQTQKENVSVTTITTNSNFPSDNTSSFSNSNSETDISKFSFSLPLALFLIIKF